MPLLFIPFYPLLPGLIAKGNIAADREYGSVFHAVLDIEGKYLQLGLKGLAFRKERRALVDMRRAFKHLVNPLTVKTAEKQSQSSLVSARNTGQFILSGIDDFLGGVFDKTAIEIILKPHTWN